MSHKKRIGVVAFGCVLALFLLVVLGAVRREANKEEKENESGVYYELPADTGTEDALLHIAEDFSVDEGFTTNLPIVVLSVEGELAEYKDFSDGMEVVDTEVDPWSNGEISVIDTGTEQNHLTDTPMFTSELKIKKRGHTSFTFDKPQYLIKLTENGEERAVDVLGMGESDSWILNGSMADKSMIRNYLSYRIASEIGGGAMAPDCRFCEVLLCDADGNYEYRGVYLFQETVSRGKSRVDIDEYKKKNTYTSYIVRRDRFTNFDVMLDTYGRLNGLSEQWIGLKYPSESKLTPETKAYIEADFSRIEQVIYAEDEDTFAVYDKYIDMDSFVDYFLINEYFGNYDAGEHSTYMYKNSGEKLCIGPVWDFDQAMNNYFGDEMDPETLAFQTKPFYERLTKDERFITCLKERYAELRKGSLSEEHVFAVMDEAVAYLNSARIREWYRWKADYEDDSFSNPHNYYLLDYEREGQVISRFNDDYEQELYNIRVYLHKHGKAIQTELTKLYDLAEYDTSMKNYNELFLLIVMLLFLTPSLLINRRG